MTVMEIVDDDGKRFFKVMGLEKYVFYKLKCLYVPKYGESR